MRIYLATVGEGGNKWGEILNAALSLNRLLSYFYFRSQTAEDFIEQYLTLAESRVNENLPGKLD